MSEKPFEDLKLQYEKAGWEYICNLASEFYVFNSVGEDTREVPPNPLVREMEIKKIKKKCLFRFIYILLYLLLLCGVLIYYGFFSDYPIYIMVNQGLFFSYVIFSIICCAYLVAKEFKTIQILKQYLKIDENDFYKEVTYNPKNKTNILDTAILLIFILALSSYLLGKLGGWKKDLLDYKGEMPTISLSTIETNPILQEIEDPIGEIIKNSIRFKSNSLASGIYEIQEWGSAKVQEGPEHIATYPTGIDSEIYNLRFQFLVSPFFEDLVEYYMDLYNYKNMECTDLEGTKFDQAYFVRDDDLQVLFASIGKKVISIQYYGNEDLSDFTDEIYKAVVEFE